MLTSFTRLLSGIVTSGFVGNAAVTSGDIASGAVGWPHLASGAVQSGDIANAAVVSGGVGSGQIGVFHFQSGLVTSGLYLSGSIGSGQIGFPHLANASVQSGTIASGVIFKLHLASGGLQSGAIGSGTLGGFEFGSGAIVSGRIASGQVGFGHLANASVQSGTLASGVVSQFALASGAVNSGQVASGAIIGQAGGGAFNIGSGTVNQFDLASGAVQSGNIASGQIGVYHLQSGLVTSGLYLSGSIGSGQVGWVHAASGTIVSGFVNENYAINGGMWFCQRWAPTTNAVICSGISGGDTYSADQWKVATSSGSSVVYTRWDRLVSGYASGADARFYGAWQMGLSGGKFGVFQPVEAAISQDIANKNIQFQFKAKSPTSGLIFRAGFLQTNSGVAADVIPNSIVSGWAVGTSGTDPTWGSGVALLGAAITAQQTNNWAVFSVPTASQSGAVNLILSVWANNAFASGSTLHMTEVGTYYD